MNPILQNLLSARGNPHVLRPLLAAVALRTLFAVLVIWMPEHKEQLAQTKAVLDPVITALVSYSTICAANSGPGRKDQPENMGQSGSSALPGTEKTTL